MKEDKVLKEYRAFLGEVDRECFRLEKLYSPWMNCGKGCSSCCRSLTLLPLEWHSMKEALLSDKGRDLIFSRSGCPFLKDSLCILYPFRPLICRTHGLPLFYLNDDGSAWELSWCDRNFPDLEEDQMEDIFQTENILNMEEWNSRLFRLNEDFLRTPEGSGYPRSERLSMDELPEAYRESVRKG